MSNQKLNISPAENAEKLRAQAEDDWLYFASTHHTFCQRVTEHMTRAGWDYNKFFNRTNLEARHYYRILDGSEEHPRLETVLNISIGLCLNPFDRDELITLSGNTWQNIKKHFLYRRVLENKIETVSDFNDAYIQLAPEEKPPLKC